LAHPAQSIRSAGVKFYRPGCGFKAVVFNYFLLLSSCRGQLPQQDRRPPFGQRLGTVEMTTFDKREEGFEKKFALDEELKFKAEARRNKLLGLWVASMLGLSGDEANAYASEVVAAAFGEAGDANVVRKIMIDLEAQGIALTEAEIRIKMDELMPLAVTQVKAGM
jgi:hypothetical protein